MSGGPVFARRGRGDEPVLFGIVTAGGDLALASVAGSTDSLFELSLIHI